MHTIDFIPEACKGDSAKFEGSVVLRAPTMAERAKYRFMAFSKLKGDPFGEQTTADKLEQVVAMAEVCEVTKDHIKEIHIRRKSDGYEFKNYEELSCDYECEAILIEIATQMVKGVLVSKNS
jgi:hypothetical protein